MPIDTSNLTEAEFIRVIIDRDTRNIFKAQFLIASRRTYLSGKELSIKKRKKGINHNAEEIENALSNPNYFMRSQGEEFLLAASVPIDIRFYDMKRKQNLQIYNRVIWGILYNNAYPDIRFGYGKEVQDRVGDALHQAFEQSK